MLLQKNIVKKYLALLPDEQTQEAWKWVREPSLDPRHWNKKMQYAQHRAKVEREKMKEEKKIAKKMETKTIIPNENVGDFDSIMDELLGKPGPPEREAFRREALEYCSQMEENENETLDDSRN